MDEKKQEFSPLPPELSAAEEFTPLPDEFGQTGGASPAVKSGRRWWKKALYALAGLAVLAAAAFSGGAAPDTPGTPDAPVVPDTPPTQEETYPLTGTLYCTAYNDTFGPDGRPLLLWDDMAVEMSALTDAPLSLPQPQQPELAGAVFLGWVGRYDTAEGKVYCLMSDPLTAAEAAAIRPDEGGDRHLVLRAAWRGDGTGRYPWQLTLDDGESAVEYDASVPMYSGGMVYLCAYPVPERAGQRFAGWCDADGAPVETLPAAAFFQEKNGETDWSAPRAVTLYAIWETA